MERERERIEEKRGRMRGVSACLSEVQPRAIWSVRVIPCLREKWLASSTGSGKDVPVVRML